MDLRTAATIELAASDANQEATSVGERAALTRLEAEAARALNAGDPDQVRESQSLARMERTYRQHELRLANR
ncbi:hypothetical protein ACIGKR_12230 [Rhodococcus qingshengii]|uniref:hypothetical protein n=1 Tax=Rhodococcus qingshengii TaxID=334542 RepID=UPI0037C9FB08